MEDILYPIANSATGFALAHVPDKTEYIFVYGTLKRGMWNHFKMEGADYKGQASVPGKLYDMGLPCYIMGDEGTVYGELYLGSKDLLKSLDRFEGYNEAVPSSSFYLRSLVTCTTVDGQSFDAWVYEYNGEVSDSRQLKLGMF